MGAGGGEISGARKAGEHGVLGDEVSVGHLVEQVAGGVGGGGEGIGMEEGGGDVDVGGEVSLEEVGVEVGEESGIMGAGLESEDGGVGNEVVLVRREPEEAELEEADGFARRGGAADRVGGGGGGQAEDVGERGEEALV